jgi:hypothetical protein
MSKAEEYLKENYNKMKVGVSVNKAMAKVMESYHQERVKEALEEVEKSFLPLWIEIDVKDVFRNEAIKEQRNATQEAINKLKE